MQINPNAQVRIERMGGLVPVLFVDDFYLNPDEVRSAALTGKYDMATALYPGRHAALGGDGGRPVLAHICRIISLLGGQNFPADKAMTDFSIVTVRPSDLLMIQKHPHVDPVSMAGILYLTPENTQGTCLFFNRFLGKFALTTPEDHAAHERLLQEYGETHEPHGYQIDENPMWERIGTIEPRYNRLVCYPGNVFHSMDIRDISPADNMETVRLTQRFFFDVAPVQEAVHA